ncbi:MAG: glycosyltransferase family 2 protein [Mycobacteriales bacterium]
MPSDPPVATVIVVNWNGERWLRPCLDALLRQQSNLPFLTWVVDNASTDGSVALLEREYPHVRVLHNSENRGFAGGNNTALRQVTTPYAVLLNNDATPEPDWLERLLAPFDEPGSERLAAVTSKVVFAPRFLPLRLDVPGFVPGGADPRELGLRIASVSVDGEDVTGRLLWERLTWGSEGVGEGRFWWTRPSGELLLPLPHDTGPWEVTVVWSGEREKSARLSWDGGSVLLPVEEHPGEQAFTVPVGAPAVDVVNNVGSLVFTAGYGADRGYQEVDAGQYDTAQEVFAICGCAVAFRTEAGRSVGWFDDDFFLYYEDTDLSWRLRLAGWTLRYEPKAVVRHVHSASSVEWSPTFVFHTTRNRLLMLVKDATRARARGEYTAFLRETLQMARPVIGALRRGRRPAARPLQARVKATGSLLRLTPGALRKRRQIGRSAVVPRERLDRELVTSR